MSAPRHLPRLLPVLGTVLSAIALVLTGCASRDSVRSAQGSFARALRTDQPTAFFGPVLARARGDATVPAPSPQVRQHYLAMLASLEAITPRGEEALRRDGLLGEALVLQALAQWRLGRLDRARTAATKARGSGQEALDQQVRALFRGLEGVLQLETALTMVGSSADYDTVFQYISGPSGAWRLLGDARAEAGRGSDLTSVLMEARLAALKTLKDSRDHALASGAGLSPTAQEAWSRLRAEGQVELTEFAALPVANPVAHAATVRQWQVLCGLDPPVR
jgi:hypothetical protein